MIAFLIVGSILVLFGLLMMISPETLVKFARRADRVYVTDANILKHRYSIGMFLVLAAGYMIYIYFTI